MDAFRLSVGLLARGICWAAMWAIVLNAVAEAIRAKEWVLAALELAFFPATVFIYPFAASDDASAWPLAGSDALLALLVIALVTYPVSTFVGRLEPIDR
jgi:hypothetical protein